MAQNVVEEGRDSAEEYWPKVKYELPKFGAEIRNILFPSFYQPVRPSGRFHVLGRGGQGSVLRVITRDIF